MTKEILVAVTDKSEQEEFQKIFELTDYHLVFSDRGEDVLLRIKLFKPDLIISKVDLRDQNGLELCEALKTDPESKHIPFILVANLFEDVSEKDRKRVKADGVLSKPLREDEVLNLVDQLMEEEAMRMKEKEISQEKEEWKSFADFQVTPKEEEEILLGEVGEEEEEIIELVDVVEEPDTKVSIHEFVSQTKTEALGEVTPFETWETIGGEEEPSDKGLDLFPKEEEKTELFDLELNKITKEAGPEEEIFEKIELQEILDKVEKLKPSIEKEWPGERELKKDEEPPPEEKVEEKSLGLEEFEKALWSEIKETPPVEQEFPLEGELPPILMEEPKVEVPSKGVAGEMEIEEERLEELTEEEFPEELLEEILGEEEVRSVEEPPQERFEEVKSKEAHKEEIMFEEMALRETTLEGVRVEKPAEVQWPGISEEQAHPLLMMVDKKMAEVIAQGVRDMMEDFIVKILPEITQNMLNLTMDRIEKMVKEVVPELAEKAIQEEIKRLQKGEKD
ncbi:MAG: response regulator [Thermodesulfobacteriota bacterium]